ncbi:hypothetical protein NIES4071_36220 [Calothrix sp. NIES-4071]|nr:hypothetical protein NIES4071_36220 [Calothrix sp. NIES-4071]BAZ57941.1 hypothetical protein NIES4105_36150 [Calothrix sp. NIES-4105]
MTDKYVEKQLRFYNNASCEAAKDDALYRIGTYLEIHCEVIPCDGNTNFTDEQRQAVLDKITEYQQEVSYE